jgi:hypothetical protein
MNKSNMNHKVHEEHKEKIRRVSDSGIFFLFLVPLWLINCFLRGLCASA